MERMFSRKKCCDNFRLVTRELLTPVTRLAALWTLRWPRWPFDSIPLSKAGSEAAEIFVLCEDADILEQKFSTIILHLDSGLSLKTLSLSSYWAHSKHRRQSLCSWFSFKFNFDRCLSHLILICQRRPTCSASRHHPAPVCLLNGGAGRVSSRDSRHIIFSSFM